MTRIILRWTPPWPSLGQMIIKATIVRRSKFVGGRAPSVPEGLAPRNFVAMSVELA
jgi:hypothetical protein